MNSHGSLPHERLSAGGADRVAGVARHDADRVRTRWLYGLVFKANCHSSTSVLIRVVAASFHTKVFPSVGRSTEATKVFGSPPVKGDGTVEAHR